MLENSDDLYILWDIASLVGFPSRFLDQELSDLNAENTVLEKVLSVFERQTSDRVLTARTILGCFLFTPDYIGKRIKVLSTGERKRIALIKVLLSEFNLLVMDEPTEHLDLPSREKLEEALVAYGGTLLLVSHDRYLLRRVCTKILAIEGQRINTYLGGFEEYQRKRATAGQEKTGFGTGGSLASLPASEDERLILEMRLARLNSELARMSREDPRYSTTEAEFFAIARSLRRDP